LVVFNPLFQEADQCSETFIFCSSSLFLYLRVYAISFRHCIVAICNWYIYNINFVEKDFSRTVILSPQQSSTKLSTKVRAPVGGESAAECGRCRITCLCKSAR
jgi:hypothetical protein